jgi:hypothetical protein
MKRLLDVLLAGVVLAQEAPVPPPPLTGLEDISARVVLDVVDVSELIRPETQLTVRGERFRILDKIESVPVDISAEQIKRDVENRLRRAGLRVVNGAAIMETLLRAVETERSDKSAEQRQMVKDAAARVRELGHLKVTYQGFKVGHLIVYSARIQVQRSTKDTVNDAWVEGTLWETNWVGSVGEEKVSGWRASAAELVDRFLDSWRAANPKAASKPGVVFPW